ncbi:protoglobin domain-containing protein [Actinophytocola sp.]|uniref:protoglobin domain-containing protein n=1 Tax=Actinophytocola sp. TaxID=1872138 RepID=UPI003D6C3126
MTNTMIPGYIYDEPALPASPVTEADLAELRASVLFGEEDEAALRRAGEVLAGQVEDVLDVWYGFVGANPHLLAHFADEDGKPLQDYLARVRVRFGQWIVDTCNRPYDARWLAYADELGRRHTAAAKNRADAARSTASVPLRHLIALIYPITATVRPFLAATGATEEEVDAMHEAWRKTVIMQVALWSRAYAPEQW